MCLLLLALAPPRFNLYFPTPSQLIAPLTFCPGAQTFILILPKNRMNRLCTSEYIQKIYF